MLIKLWSHLHSMFYTCTKKSQSGIIKWTAFMQRLSCLVDQSKRTTQASIHPFMPTFCRQWLPYQTRRHSNKHSHRHSWQSASCLGSNHRSCGQWTTVLLKSVLSAFFFLSHFIYLFFRVTALSMSPVDDTFISGSLDRTIRIWDLRSPNCQVSSL